MLPKNVVICCFSDSEMGKETLEVFLTLKFSQTLGTIGGGGPLLDSLIIQLLYPPVLCTLCT